MGFKTINGKKVFIDDNKRRSGSGNDKSNGMKIGNGTRVPKFVVVKDEDGEIDVFDKSNMDHIDDIVEVEAERRVEDISLDDFEEFVNETSSPVESGGVTANAGTFQRKHDAVGFRTARNDYANSKKEDFVREARSEIDEEESLKENRFVN